MSFQNNLVFTIADRIAIHNQHTFLHPVAIRIYVDFIIGGEGALHDGMLLPFHVAPLNDSS